MFKIAFLHVGMPDFIWKMILQQPYWCLETSTKSFSGHSRSFDNNVTINDISWKELVGNELSIVKSFQDVLSMTKEDLEALEMEFVGSKVVWDGSRLHLKEVHNFFLSLITDN